MTIISTFLFGIFLKLQKNVSVSNSQKTPQTDINLMHAK